MRAASLLSLVLAALLGTACTPPSPRTCNDHFIGGQAPIITSEALSKTTALLCYEEFAVMHSGIARTPLWSAEHLDEKQVNGAKAIKRKNTFHAEDRLPESDRAELSDYARSGYDRGHMAPSGNMPTETAQHESFSLANIIPQNPKNNQRLWAAIEEATRDRVEAEGPVYIVTGPIFEGASLQRLNGRVLIPTAVYKAIYDPVRNQAAAYVTPNAPGMEYQTLSIAELEQRIKINVFPNLPAEIKAAKMVLPPPTSRGSRSRNKAVEVAEPSTR
jgi:endonuclease G